jgi:hypothetical protein
MMNSERNTRKKLHCIDQCSGPTQGHRDRWHRLSFTRLIKNQPFSAAC